MPLAAPSCVNSLLSKDLSRFPGGPGAGQPGLLTRCYGDLRATDAECPLQRGRRHQGRNRPPPGQAVSSASVLAPPAGGSGLARSRTGCVRMRKVGAGRPEAAVSLREFQRQLCRGHPSRVASPPSPSASRPPPAHSLCPWGAGGAPTEAEPRAEARRAAPKPRSFPREAAVPRQPGVSEDTHPPFLSLCFSPPPPPPPPAASAPQAGAGQEGTVCPHRLSKRGRGQVCSPLSANKGKGSKCLFSFKKPGCQPPPPQAPRLRIRHRQTSSEASAGHTP